MFWGWSGSRIVIVGDEILSRFLVPFSAAVLRRSTSEGSLGAGWDIFFTPCFARPASKVDGGARMCG